MMKTLNLLSIIFLFSLASVNVSGQLTSGSTWLGGSIGYSSNTSESQFSPKTKMQSFNINPAIGKVVKPSLVAGIELSYNSSKEERTGSPFEVKNKLYGAGIFARKYMETFKKLYLFAHAGLGGAVARYHVTNNFPPNSEAEGWQANISLYPGVSYALNAKVFLEVSLNNLFTISYSNSKTRTLNDVYKSNSFSANVNLSNVGTFGVGIRFILPGSVGTKTK